MSSPVDNWSDPFALPASDQPQRPRFDAARRFADVRASLKTSPQEALAEAAAREQSQHWGQHGDAAMDEGIDESLETALSSLVGRLRQAPAHDAAIDVTGHDVPPSRFQDGREAAGRALAALLSRISGGVRSGVAASAAMSAGVMGGATAMLRASRGLALPTGRALRLGWPTLRFGEISYMREPAAVLARARVRPSRWIAVALILGAMVATPLIYFAVRPGAPDTTYAVASTEIQPIVEASIPPDWTVGRASALADPFPPTSGGVARQPSPRDGESTGVAPPSASEAILPRGGLSSGTRVGRTKGTDLRLSSTAVPTEAQDGMAADAGGTSETTGALPPGTPGVDLKTIDVRAKARRAQTNATPAPKRDLRAQASPKVPLVPVHACAARLFPDYGAGRIRPGQLSVQQICADPNLTMGDSWRCMVATLTCGAD